MGMFQSVGYLGEAWRAYQHAMPGINFIVLVIVIGVLVWIGSQTLKNRYKIIELELEAKKRSEEGLEKILNKLDCLKKD